MRLAAPVMFIVASIAAAPRSAAQSVHPDLVDVLEPDSARLSTVVGRYVRFNYGSSLSEYVATYLAWAPRLSERLSLELVAALVHERHDNLASPPEDYTLTTTGLTVTRVGVARTSGRYMLRAALLLPGYVWGDDSEHTDDVHGILQVPSRDEGYGGTVGISRAWRRDPWGIVARLDIDLRRFVIEDPVWLPLPQLAVGGTARLHRHAWAILEASLRWLDPRIVRVGAGVDAVTPRVSAGLRVYLPHEGENRRVLEYELQATIRY